MPRSPIEVVARHAHVVEEDGVGADVRHRPDALHRRCRAGPSARSSSRCPGASARRARCAPPPSCGVAVCAPVFQIFWPLITHSSPSSSARVRERRQVGAGLRLRVGDGEVDARRAGCAAATPPSAPRCRRAGWSGATEVTESRIAGRARHLHLLDEDVLLDGRLPEAAELLRPPDAPPALVEELLVERARERPVALVAGLPHLGAQRLGDVLARRRRAPRRARRAARACTRSASDALSMRCAPGLARRNARARLPPSRCARGAPGRDPIPAIACCSCCP